MVQTEGLTVFYLAIADVEAKLKIYTTILTLRIRVIDSCVEES